ncbi:MAG: glycosyltransferase [Chitinophagaceae bacterium]|nr:glycosyltransferase [Chitinophagaceae bacterium]
MSVIISHPTGNKNVRAVLEGLDSEGLLEEFHTTLLADAHSAWVKLLPASFRNEWLRKTYPVGSNKVITHPALEIARMLFLKLGIKGPIRTEYGWASVDAVYHNLDTVVSKRISELKKQKDIKAVYAYEDGALSTFKVAKKLGIKCIYDLPIAYWETSLKLLKEEANRLPQWAATIGGGTTASEAKLERKIQELELADTVVCPGTFVRNSIPIWALNKQIIMSPFGSPQNVSKAPVSNERKGKPLRVLFAGSMGQRKGLGDLFAAFRLLNTDKVELVVMGSPLASMDFYKSEFNNFTYEPGRQHEKVLELMRSCDVLCLPSIVEGRALVMQEAMSQGLPVLITPNTGGEDLIIEGSTGFLVPIRSPEVIAEKISWLLDNRDSISEMGNMARQHALSYTWEKYQQNIIQSLRSDFHFVYN